MRHCTWEEFQRDYITPGVGGAYSPHGEPDVQVYASPGGRRIGVLVAVADPATIKSLPLRQASLALKMKGTQYYADFSTTNDALYEQFFGLISQVADSVQLDGELPARAIDLSITKLRSLLAEEKLLNEDTLVGLWGELWVLKRLISGFSESVVQCWKGSEGAVHDFRRGLIELEVKTTRNEDRKHIISKLSQLDSSPDCDLYICSIQVIEGIENGRSVPESVHEIEAILSEHPATNEEFRRKLKQLGYSTEDESFYSKKYYLRSPPLLVPVTKALPKLNRALIESAFGTELASRIEQVSYQLDVSGLGFGEEDSRYVNILG